MFSARSIGVLLTLAAAGLVLVGTWAWGTAEDARRASLRRSARVVGEFFSVWLLRDGVELALTREAWTPAHGVDLACVVAGAVLAVSAIAVGRVPAAWLAQARVARRVRVALSAVASTAGVAALARMFV